MKNRTTRGLPRHSVAAGLLFGSAVFVMAAVFVNREQHGAIAYTPPRNLPRLLADTIRLPATATLIDFAGDSTDLYFLDGMVRNIVHVRRRESGWSLHGLHSRRGEGPGELRNPRSVAVRSDTLLVVSDLDELDVFDRGGTYLHTLRPELPCAASVVDLSGAADVLFGSVNCIHGDTMSAVLFRYDGNSSTVPILKEPRLSLSGRWGSGFAALRSIGDDSGGIVFGTGTLPCVTRQAAADSDHHRECWALPPYRSDPPKGFRSGPGMAWPDTLPYFVDRAGSTRGHVFLIRPYRADSAVIVTGGPASYTPLMVVPLSSMIGCRAVGCAWTEDGPGHTTVHLVPLTRLDSLANAAKKP